MIISPPQAASDCATRTPRRRHRDGKPLAEWLPEVAAEHSLLPFGARVVPATSLRAIVEDWLSSPYVDGIP
jgi:hypothetical protein